MNKLIPILLLLMISKAAVAQDYACILPAQKQYFLRTDNYLRGMRIDSMGTSGDTSFYYPFHTPRFSASIGGGKMDMKGASWMGAKIIELKDGRYWFFNYWGDTVEIQTQARLNDKWIIHHDTNDIYYEAQVTAIDTATVLGMVDSIKTITISAYNKNGANTTAIANGLQCVLSKQHGFYKALDLLFFPYHDPGDDSAWSSLQGDYYSNKVGVLGTYTLIDFKNPRLSEVYDYNVGDIFFILDLPNVQSGEAEIYYYDSVEAVIIIPTGKEYHILRTEHTPIYPKPGPSPTSITYTTKYIRYAIIADSSYLITEFPEESWNKNLYYYFPHDTSYCIDAPLFQISGNQLIGDRPYGNIDVKLTDWEYKVGIGKTYESVWQALQPRFMSYSRTMKYIRTRKVNCGSYSFPLSINNTSLHSVINIYPNPVQGNTVYIDVQHKSEAYRLTVYDAVGKQVLTKTINQASSVDVSQLSTGVYLFEIVSDKERIVKPVTIN